MNEQSVSSVMACVVALTFAGVASTNPMTMTENKPKNDAAIRELLDGFVKAFRAKDIDAVMAVFAPEVISFDFDPPLQHGGGAEFRKRWLELFEACLQCQSSFETRGRRFSPGGDSANRSWTHGQSRVAKCWTRS